jgi:hypothetical protein
MMPVAFSYYQRVDPKDKAKAVAEIRAHLIGRGIPEDCNKFEWILHRKLRQRFG